MAELRAAYHHAISATERVTATVDSLLADMCIPGEPYALARALQRNPITAHSQHQDTTLLRSRATTAAELGPGAGDIERLLHSLNISDPELLLRAIALDHATRDLTAQALTKADHLASARQARHRLPLQRAAQLQEPRNRSARLAAQDLPGPGRTQTPSAPAAQNPPAGAISSQSPDAPQQRRDTRSLPQQPTPAAR
jgi:hypothetical protein